MLLGMSFSVHVQQAFTPHSEEGILTGSLQSSRFNLGSRHQPDNKMM